MPIVAFVINALRVMLMVRAGLIVAKILAFFGFQFAVNKYGVQPTVDYIESLIQTGPGGEYGADAMAWAGVLNLDIAVSWVLSAYVAAWSIKSIKVFITQAGS